MEKAEVEATLVGLMRASRRLTTPVSRNDAEGAKTQRTPCKMGFIAAKRLFASLPPLRLCVKLPLSLPLFQPIVGSFLGDDYIVNVRLAQPGASDANELTLILKFSDVATPCVAHSRTQSAHQLGRHLRDGALIGNAALDTLWNQLRFALGHLLSIPVARAFAHRPD